MSSELPPFFWSDSHTTLDRMKSRKFSDFGTGDLKLSLVSKVLQGRFLKVSAETGFSHPACIPNVRMVSYVVIPPYLKTANVRVLIQIRRNCAASAGPAV